MLEYMEKGLRYSNISPSKQSQMKACLKIESDTAIAISASKRPDKLLCCWKVHLHENTHLLKMSRKQHCAYFMSTMKLHMKSIQFS